MAWEIEVGNEFERGNRQNVIDRALSLLEPGAGEAEVGSAVEQAIDECCMYSADQLAAILHYGHVGAAFELAYEDMRDDIWEAVSDGLEGAEG